MACTRLAANFRTRTLPICFDVWPLRWLCIQGGRFAFSTWSFLTRFVLPGICRLIQQSWPIGICVAFHTIWNKAWLRLLQQKLTASDRSPQMANDAGPVFWQSWRSTFYFEGARHTSYLDTLFAKRSKVSWIAYPMPLSKAVSSTYSKSKFCSPGGVQLHRLKDHITRSVEHPGW